MEQILMDLEAAVSAAGLCVVYNAEDWQLLSDANLTLSHPFDTEVPRYLN